MKRFWKLSKKPFVVACIAAVLYIIDALIGPHLGGSFMWMAFAFWTVFFGASIKDRIKGLIGTAIGFFAAVIMMLITSSFNVNVSTISISCLIGVFVVNMLVMYLEKADKVWMNSISGVFVGIMLTFSGFGIGMNPIVSFADGATMLGILLLYAVLGMLCGFFTLLFTKDKKIDAPAQQQGEESSEVEKKEDN